MGIFGLLIDRDVGREGVEAPTSQSLLANLLPDGSVEHVPRRNIFSENGDELAHLNSG